MALHKNHGDLRHRKLLDQVKSTIDTQADDLATDAQTQGLISLESLDPATFNALDQHVEGVERSIEGMLTSIGFEGFDDSTVIGKRVKANALKAGAIVAMAHGNPVAYARQGYEGQAKANGSIKIGEVISGGVAGSMDYRDAIGLESFDERELREYLPYSVVFNVFANRQDDFSETLFPTTVVTPDAAGLDVSVNRSLVFQEVRHAITGQPANFKKKNLIDAAVDFTILADETTRLIPVRQTDGSNASFFVDPAVIAPSFAALSGVSIPTAPLAMGPTVDLLGISQFPALIGAGIIDNTDSIDGRITLENVYMLAEAGEVGIKFPTKNLPRNNFVKSIEGNGREMNLQFSSRDLVLNAATVHADGTTPTNTALALIRTSNYTVRVSVAINGVANVEFGNVQVYTSPLQVVSITDANGVDVSLTQGNGQTIAAAIAGMKLVGYDLHVNRTNLNRRTRGHLLDTTWETERYPISLGSPLSIPSPATATKDAADLKTLINAARVRNSNNAVTALFNIADALRAYVSGPKPADGSIPNVGGMGRFLVQPFYEERNFDLLLAINNVKSQDRAQDVQSALVNVCRDVSYRMYRDTRIQPAIDALNGSAGETPTLFVGCDQVLERHLMVTGDTRTFGTAFDKFEVKSTFDKRMRNKIVLTFIRPQVSGPDPLSFGTHAWIPELTSSIMVNRNGATIKEAMVQPRTLHVNNLPVLAVINVLNLTAALSQKIDTGHFADAIGQGNLGGINYP
jgi:hypothetical protein